MALLLAYLALLLFSMHFRFTVFLYDWVPQFMTALTVGAIGGLWYAWISIPQLRMENKPYGYILQPFYYGVCFFGLLGWMYHDYVAYFFHDKNVSYVTEYKFVFPGPSYGKYSRCDIGLKIKDKTLGQWITICSSSEELNYCRQKGMDKIHVVEQVSRYGVRLNKAEC
ncbi:conserved membrane hypothetical protein [Enterobacterales bacterium 8AC]|nr:conserved membrane hypothetical protein [Enterobacterales bacterium 8AC]